MKLSGAKHFKNRNEWRKWLHKNHGNVDEIWLIFYKKHTGKPGITHSEAVEESLCFGWIDSKVKRIDDERFIQKYTPRKPNSVWSKINKESAQKMIREGKMSPSGFEKIKEAKRSGKWSAAYTSRRKLAMPNDLKKALMKKKKAWNNFSSFANTYQNMYIGWVDSAKRKEMRERRIGEVVRRAARNQKPGMM